MHWAAFSGDEDIVQFLVDKKADANIRNAAGLIPFQEALNQGKRPLAEILARVSKLDENETYTAIREEGE